MSQICDALKALPDNCVCVCMLSLKLTLSQMFKAYTPLLLNTCFNFLSFFGKEIKFGWSPPRNKSEKLFWFP